MKQEYTFEELQQAAITLCSSIADTSFAYPDSKDKLFSGNKKFWKLNACIDKFYGAETYTLGYLNAAKLLARIVIFSGSNMDTLVYPIIYLYRHYLEMSLKNLIRSGANITGTTIDQKLAEALSGHNLMNLWNKFKPFLETISGHNEDFESVKKGIESYINQIHAIDPTSIAFRYDRSKTSTSHNLDGIEHINILQFCENFEKLSGLIEGIGCEFGLALDYVNEM